jgi:D-specific alpha-keto acid dehydrogenase
VTSAPSRTAESPTPPSAPTIGVTAYGCGPHEAALFRDLAPRLGVVPTLTAAAPSESNAHLASGTRCVSVDHKTPVTRATLHALRETGVAYLSTRSIGRNHVDTRWATRLGIEVGTVSYSPDSVADYTLMLMLMAVRHAKPVIRRADCHDYRLHDVPGRELRDLTVGVVGTGRIGTAVVDRLRGFGCRLLTHDLRPGAADVPLDVLLEHSDIVSLHVPLTSGTHHLLDERRIARMRAGAHVVNTGRGGLLDTEALLVALEGGRLGGAALDVVEGEQDQFYADRRRAGVVDLLSRLHALPNVLISPHTAYYTDHALRDAVEGSLVGCIRFETRRTP